jgi:hypothetical protein
LRIHAGLLSSLADAAHGANGEQIGALCL